MSIRAVWTCVASGILVMGLARSAPAQDPLKVGPDIYKLVFENQYVRVMEVTFKPGAKIEMHSHPDHLVYIISGEGLTLKYPDGQTKKMASKPGEAVWIKAEKHAAENTGTSEVRGLVVELKD